ncbi:MAG: non-canonical purine NTP pyrophosphatase [Bacillota bacterium]
MLNTIGIEGILKLLGSEENRECEFRSCLAYYGGEEMRFFESKFPGIIAEKIRGSENESKWSDLWYLFIPQHFHKTLAEFNEQDFIKYNRVKEDSGIKKFGEWFSVSR